MSHECAASRATVPAWSSSVSRAGSAPASPPSRRSSPSEGRWSSTPTRSPGSSSSRAPTVFAAMVERFGDGIVAADGTLDRQAVADIVFNDAEALKDLGAIVHPAVGVEIARRLEAEEGTDHVVILDVPLLVESGRDDLAALVVVDVDPEVAVERLVRAAGHAGGRRPGPHGQPGQPREERLAKADHVIDNSGTRRRPGAAGRRRCGRGSWRWAPTARCQRSAATAGAPTRAPRPTSPRGGRCSRSCGRWRRCGTSSATRSSGPAGRRPLLAVGVGLGALAPGRARPAGVLARRRASSRCGRRRRPREPLAARGLRRPRHPRWPRPRRRCGDAGTTPADLADRVFPVARLCLLGFYAFAAFAKLNTAFFDRSDELRGLLLPGVDRLARALRRCSSAERRGSQWAVIVGHGGRRAVDPGRCSSSGARGTSAWSSGWCSTRVLALDRTHQFFDFSSVLAALFVLFLPPSAGAWVAERVGSVRARLALRRRAAAAAGAPRAWWRVPAAAGLLVAARRRRRRRRRWTLGWWPWQLYAIAVPRRDAAVPRPATAGPDARRAAAAPRRVPARAAPRGRQRADARTSS